MLATSMAREFAVAGDAIGYGPHIAPVSERAAAPVAKILAGANRGELPVERPTNFHLVVNLRAAKALGLSVPDAVLLRADEVIR